MNQPAEDIKDVSDAVAAGVNISPEDAERNLVREGIESYYDLDRKEFLIENAEGIWVSLNESQFKRQLRSMGISIKVGDGMVSPAEKVILKLIDERTVRYAAPLAGRQAGYYREGGTSFLVTESLKLPVAAGGDYPTIWAVIVGLLGGGEHGDHQTTLFLSWLRIAVISLRSGNPQPGQAMAIAGPADCGKSLLQKIITEVLGGRSAKAALFLTARTNFNAELFEAEHLMLEDEAMTPDMRSRRALGDSIKGIVVNELHACHRKHRTPVNLRPWWRLSITVNDDPEAMLVLPPLDDNIKDKITLLQAQRFDMPMPTATADERRAFWQAIESEVPMLVNYLETTETPEKLLCRRYGVTTWHHPELVDDLDALSAEAHLLSLIDRALFECPTDGEREMTADEVKRELMSDISTRDEARDLLKWRNATGTLMGKLAKMHPERVKKAVRGGEQRLRKWVIAPPDTTT